MSSSDLELQKMVRGFRVSDLQSLLIYAGRNKGGKKSELQSRALDLVKLHSASIDMKIRELHRNRYQQSHGPSEPQELFVPDLFSPGISDPMASNYSNMPHHKSSVGPGYGVPNYMNTINHQMLRSAPALNIIQQYPVNPDVRFKDLPFYDVLSELVKPTSLVQVQSGLSEKTFQFCLTPQGLRELDSDTDVQVQFRIACLESNREQEDEFPASILVKINNKIATLPNPIPTNKPGCDPKRPKRPVDLTCWVKRSSTEPQVLYVSWASSNSKPFVMGVFLVRKQSSSVLIKRLKDIGVRNPDHTTAMIKEKLCHDRDSEIATMSLRGSLLCPLGKIKMQLPCRALTCTHLQCFDAGLYIQMNEKKPKWICPVCDKPALFKSLAIDGLFLDITRKVPSECTEVQFHENGSWTPVIPVKKVPEVNEASVPVQTVEKPKPKKSVEIISLDSDSDTEDSWPVPPPKKKPYKPASGGGSGIMSPVLIDSPEIDIPPAESSLRSFKITRPCPPKSVPSTSKSSALPPLDKNPSSQPLSAEFPYLIDTTSTKDFESSSSTFSPQSPTHQPSTSSAFQDTVDILNNTSNTAGQCAFDFDLYSLIQQNHEDTFQYQQNAAEETLNADETPDIISLDDDDDDEPPCT